MKWLMILPLLLILIVPVNVQANKTKLDLPLFPPEIPKLSDTGYTLSKNEIIICKIKMPEANSWRVNSEYGGGIGVDNIAVYTVADAGWFSTTPILRVFSGTEKVKDVPLENNAFGKPIEIYIAYLSDGTVKISYRYGQMTAWRFIYSEVAPADILTVKSVNAFDFEKKKVSGDSSDPIPTITTKEDEKREKQEKINIALAGLGGIAIAVLVTMINRRRVK